MNEKFIVGLSTLFNIDKETVIKAVENKDGDDSILNTWKESNVVRSKTDQQTYETNLVKQTKEAHILELKEKAKSKELPQELYGFFKGNVSEELERKLSKAFEIADYEGFDDLTAKIKSKKFEDTHLKTDLATLQERNKALQKEAEEAIKAAEKKFNDELIHRDKTAAMNALTLDYAPEAIEKQKQLLKVQIESKYKFDRREEKTIVLDEKGDILKDKNTLIPLSITDVATMVAKEFDFKLKSPESGGQGGSSSQGNAGAGMSFEDYAKSKNVIPFSNAGTELFREWQKTNK